MVVLGRLSSSGGGGAPYLKPGRLHRIQEKGISSMQTDRYAEQVRPAYPKASSEKLEATP